MNNYLKRQYYEDDLEGFYYNKINIDCWEQMIYQTLRNYRLDYKLFFCQDINPFFWETETEFDVYPNILTYNDHIYTWNLCTTDYSMASNCIEKIINDGNIVIFSTMFDRLKSYIWYHETGEYTRCSHFSIIIGYDKDYFYYVDSPPMRNKLYFHAHPENNTVGLIPREELIDAFRLYCMVGFISVDTKRINSLASTNQILHGICQKYFQKNSCELRNMEGIKGYVGELAFQKLILALRNNKKSIYFLEDPFVSSLFGFRVKNLKYNLELHNKNSTLLQDILHQLDSLIHAWQKVHMFILKYSLTHNINIYQIIISELENVLQTQKQLINNISSNIAECN